MIIELKNILNSKTYPEAGDALYYIIQDALNIDDKVTIDMEGVISVPTIFMNTSFGAIIDNFGVGNLKKTIGFRNITKSQAERIQRYIQEYQKMIEQNDL